MRTIVRMPLLQRPDGAEIAWSITGEAGPLVAIALTAIQPAVACQRIVGELAADHRVLSYDLRGTGGSSRVGPYDMETDAADLAAVVEHAGGGALVVGLGDGARRAVRAASARPDLIHTVVISGEMPLGPIREGGSNDALADSPAVLEALLGLLESNYRTGLRTMFDSSGEAGWHDMTLQARLDATEAYCPPEAGIQRLRAWGRDDSWDHALALGDRLWFLHFPANAWFQGSLEAIRHRVPGARFEAVSEGVIASPEENATALRRILAARRPISKE